MSRATRSARRRIGRVGVVMACSLLAFACSGGSDAGTPNGAGTTKAPAPADPAPSDDGDRSDAGVDADAPGSVETFEEERCNDLDLEPMSDLLGVDLKLIQFTPDPAPILGGGLHPVPVRR